VSQCVPVIPLVIQHKISTSTQSFCFNQWSESTLKQYNYSCQLFKALIRAHRQCQFREALCLHEPVTSKETILFSSYDMSKMQWSFTDTHSAYALIAIRPLVKVDDVLVYDGVFLLVYKSRLSFEDHVFQLTFNNSSINSWNTNFVFALLRNFIK